MGANRDLTKFMSSQQTFQDRTINCCGREPLLKEVDGNMFLGLLIEEATVAAVATIGSYEVTMGGTSFHIVPSLSYMEDCITAAAATQ